MFVVAVKAPFIVPTQNSCQWLKGGSGEKRLNTFSLNLLQGNTHGGVNLLSCWLLRAFDVWFLRSAACVTGEKAAREAECLGFFLFLWIHDERYDFASTMLMQL